MALITLGKKGAIFIAATELSSLARGTALTADRQTMTANGSLIHPLSHILEKSLSLFAESPILIVKLHRPIPL
jgi:hypothetical protein